MGKLLQFGNSRARWKNSCSSTASSQTARLKARDTLIEQHLAWAHAIARKVARRLPTWFTVEDLVGPAEIGLIQAAERYNPEKNDNFRAYAQRRVYGQCIASIRRREYSERALLSIDTVRERSSAAPGPESTAQAAIANSTMWKRVAELPAANARVLRSHYFAEMTLSEIAGHMNVSVSWVSRLHRQGLEMLRLRCRDLEDLAA